MNSVCIISSGRSNFDDCLAEMDEFKEILKSFRFTNNQNFEISEPQLKPVHNPLFETHSSSTLRVKAICLPENVPKAFNSTFLNTSYKQFEGIRIKFHKHQTLNVYMPFSFKKTGLTSKAADYNFCTLKRRPIEGEIKRFDKFEWQLFEKEPITNEKFVIHLPLAKFEKSRLWSKSELKLINEWGLCGLDCINQEEIIVNYAKNFNSCLMRNFDRHLKLKISNNFAPKPSRSRCLVNRAALKCFTLIEAIVAKDWAIEETNEEVDVIQVQIENCIFCVINHEQVEAIHQAPHDFIIIETENGEPLPSVEPRSTIFYSSNSARTVELLESIAFTKNKAT